MKYFALSPRILPHEFDDDVRLGWFGDVDGVELLAVHVDPVPVRHLAHFATQLRPVDRHTVRALLSVDPFAQPGPEAVQVDVLDRTRALAGRDQRISVLARVQTDPTNLLAVGLL